MRLLAETVSIDGRIIALILAILLVVLLAGVAIIVAGFVSASRAARGSDSARQLMVFIVGVELIAGVWSLIGSGPPSFTVGCFVIAGAQAALYFSQRSQS